MNLHPWDQLNNPYLVDFNKLAQPNWSNPDTFIKYTNEWKKLVAQYSFAVPNYDILMLIARFSNNIVEVGAGTGYWASLLSKLDVQVSAYDTQENDIIDYSNSYYPVNVNNHEIALKENPNSDLLLVWPDLTASWPIETITSHTRMVFYVGDYRLTGGDGFHMILSRKYSLVLRQLTISWQGTNDTLNIYTRRKN